MKALVGMSAKTEMKENFNNKSELFFLRIIEKRKMPQKIVIQNFETQNVSKVDFLITFNLLEINSIS